MEDKIEISLPNGMTREDVARVLRDITRDRNRRNARARLRRQLRREGKLPHPGSGHYTFVYSGTRAHNLLYLVSRSPVPLTYIPPLDGTQFLRLLKWDLISFDSTLDEYIRLTEAGEDALKLLGEGITATIYKEEV